jgi:DNA-binding LacI/PurR family transcriptional regulator
MTTQQELANRLGVDLRTVSAILTGRITADTIDTVLRAAQEAGYQRPDRNRPTMTDIGQRLGLSHASVSAALRPPRPGASTTVSAETRARVQALADELGYIHPSKRAA